MVIGLPSSTGQLTDLTNSPGAGDNFFLPHNNVLIGGDDMLVPFLQKLITWNKIYPSFGVLHSPLNSYGPGVSVTTMFFVALAQLLALSHFLQRLDLHLFLIPARLHCPARRSSLLHSTSHLDYFKPRNQSYKSSSKYLTSTRQYRSFECFQQLFRRSWDPCMLYRLC